MVFVSCVNVMYEQQTRGTVYLHFYLAPLKEVQFCFLYLPILTLITHPL